MFLEKNTQDSCYGAPSRSSHSKILSDHDALGLLGCFPSFSCYHGMQSRAQSCTMGNPNCNCTRIRKHWVDTLTQLT